jgi:hypothetical protein
MIQRVQSIFLFLIGVCMVVMLFVPIWTKENAATQEIAKLTALQLTYQKQTQTVSQVPTFYVGILAVLTMVIAYVSMFSFKNRMLQIKLNWANSLVMIGLLGTCTYLAVVQGESMVATATKGNYGIGLFLPAIALILNSLANRFIWKDEKLVKSIDRLR